MATNINPLIGNQTTPLVKATPGNPVFTGTLQTWIAYGGCLSINTFDAVQPLRHRSDNRVISLIPAGNTSRRTLLGGHVERHESGDQSRVISLPYAFGYINTDPNAAGNALSGRAQLLRDVLRYFGIVGDSGNVSAVLPGITFQTSNYPNPFNPEHDDQVLDAQGWTSELERVQRARSVG